MAVEQYKVKRKTTLKNGKVKVQEVKLYRGIARFKDDMGVWKSKKRGGFATKREALDWVERYKDTRDGKPYMTFEAFYKYYLSTLVNGFDDDGKIIKGSTLKTKDVIFKKASSPILWRNDYGRYN